MAGWVDDFTNAVGSVTTVLKQGAETYDKITGKSDQAQPQAAAQPAKVSEPATTTGVDTTKGTTPKGSGDNTLILLAVGVIVLLALS